MTGRPATASSRSGVTSDVGVRAGAVRLGEHRVPGRRRWASCALLRASVVVGCVVRRRSGRLAGDLGRPASTAWSWPSSLPPPSSLANAEHQHQRRGRAPPAGAASRRVAGSGPRVSEVMARTLVSGAASDRRCHTAVHDGRSMQRHARADPGLVRRPRARPAVARSGGEPVVGDGLGVHAPADAGRPGAAGARGVAGAAGPRPPPSPPSRTGEAVRAWGRLGYPRRALRLHAAAVAIVERHGGEVPAAYDDLLALPGRRRLHRGGDRQRSPTGAGTSCSTPTCAGCWRGWWPAWSSRPRRSTRAEREPAAALLPEDDADRGDLVGGA